METEDLHRDLEDGIPSTPTIVEQLDIKMAFLHRDLEEDIYMSQPGRLHGDEGGRSPHMPIEKKPLWLKTSVENVVLEIRCLDIGVVSSGHLVLPSNN